MRKSARTRKTQSLSKKFAVYSAVGGACGLTFGVTAAEAGIVHTDFSKVATITTPQGIDLDGDNVNDFTFSLTLHGPNAYGSNSNWAAIRGEGINKFASTVPSPYFSGFSYGPANLAAGETIADKDFHGGMGPMQMAYTLYGPTHIFGAFGGENFSTPASGFIGLQFTTGYGDTVFGWVKVAIVGDVTNPNFRSAQIQIFDGAYATDGADILAGQTVPEPASITLTALGMLAMGAVGVMERRRRKAAQ